MQSYCAYLQFIFLANEVTGMLTVLHIIEKFVEKLEDMWIIDLHYQIR